MIVESVNQFKFACVLFSGGVLAGLACDLVFGVFYLLNLRKLGRILLSSYYFFSIFLFINLSKFFEMPSLRLYMPLTFILGSIIYYKSFHKYVAFFYKFCYNKLDICLKKYSKSNNSRFLFKNFGLLKRKHYGRKKDKKGSSGERSNSSVPVGVFTVVYDLPNVHDKRKKAHARGKRKENRRA